MREDQIAVIEALAEAIRRCESALRRSELSGVGHRTSDTGECRPSHGTDPHSDFDEKDVLPPRGEIASTKRIRAERFFPIGRKQREASIG